MKLLFVILGLSLVILMAEARPQEAESEQAQEPATPAAPKRNLRQVTFLTFACERQTTQNLRVSTKIKKIGFEEATFYISVGLDLMIY